MAWPDHISVYHKLRTAPTDSTESFSLDVLILSNRHQRAAARCIEDILVYDYTRGSKTRLPLFMAQKFTEMWRAQEETKSRIKNRIKLLHERVTQLEKQSWDKEGAVEDTGRG